jgi:RimJ/RimL family protein N-acetyltransferase
MATPVNQVLLGSRILLRPPTPADAEEIFASIASDPEVARFLSWRPHADVAETRRVISELFNVGDDHTWVIALRDGGQIVGQIGYRRLQRHIVELGYCLATRWSGQGLVAEAVSVILQVLQQDSQLYRVQATCHVDNARSARVLEKCGLALEGRLVRHTVFPNLGPDPRDCLLYGRAMR